jgi:DnaJ-class molecular chaperone
MVTITSKEGEVVQPFSWKILKDEGMPIRGTGEFGELHVKMLVNFPKELNAK